MKGAESELSYVWWGEKGICIVRWACPVERRRSDEASIKSLTDKLRLKIEGQEEMWKAFLQHLPNCSGEVIHWIMGSFLRTSSPAGHDFWHERLNVVKGWLQLQRLKRCLLNVPGTSRWEWMVCSMNFIIVCQTCSDTCWHASTQTVSRMGGFPGLWVGQLWCCAEPT